MLNFKNFIYNIQEGLIKTFPLDKSLSIIEREIINIPYWYNITKDYDKNSFAILFEGILNKNQTEGFMRIVNNLGYFCSCFYLYKKSKKLFIWKDINDFILQTKSEHIQKIEFFFESKFDAILEYKPSKLYHVTNKIFISKIKKIGLIPKSLNKKINHLDRIYFTLNIESALKIKKSLVSNYILNNIVSIEDYDNIEDMFLILEIDITDNYYNSLNLFKDPNMKNGYYTYQNIKPNDIKIIY